MNEAYNKLVGSIIGDFEVLSLDHIDNNNRKHYRTRCTKCGREHVVNGSDLLRGYSITHKSTCPKIMAKNGECYDKRFHQIWANLKKRTTNPNDPRYSEYGGRGIKSDDFHCFADFYDLMHNSYLEAIERYGEDAKLSIDRIDVDKDYTQENCRWITMGEQSGNTRRNKLFKAVDPDGNVHYAKNQSLFARMYGMNRSMVQAYISGKRHNKDGWSFELVKNPKTIPLDMIEDNMMYGG